MQCSVMPSMVGVFNPVQGRVMLTRGLRRQCARVLREQVAREVHWMVLNKHPRSHAISLHPSKHRDEHSSPVEVVYANFFSRVWYTSPLAMVHLSGVYLL